jgi:hypothetical protein
MRCQLVCLLDTTAPPPLHAAGLLIPWSLCPRPPSPQPAHLREVQHVLLRGRHKHRGLAARLHDRLVEHRGGVGRRCAALRVGAARWPRRGEGYQGVRPAGWKVRATHWHALSLSLSLAGTLAADAATLNPSRRGGRRRGRGGGCTRQHRRCGALPRRPPGVRRAEKRCGAVQLWRTAQSTTAGGNPSPAPGENFRRIDLNSCFGRIIDGVKSGCCFMSVTERLWRSTKALEDRPQTFALECSQPQWDGV